MGNLAPNTLLPLEPETFSNESRAVIDFLTDYYHDIEKYPVRAEVELGHLRKLLPDEAPLHGQPIDAILDDVRKDILSGLSHWQSPRFFAYFPMNASTAGFAGEMLSAGLNVVPFVWIASPAAAELEGIVVDWMGKLLDLPPCFLSSGGGGGVLHGSTCEAVVCILTSARDCALSKLGHESIIKLVIYASDQTHCTFQKGAKIIGIPPSNFWIIPTSADSDYALTADSVRAVIKTDIANGLVPLYLCATVGTTGLGAVDLIQELGEVANQYAMWLHVDAAYAGSAAICPEFQHHLNGAELADSVSMNPHKWFLTNMDCSCLWLKNPSALVRALSTDPEYLKNYASDTKMVVDYKDWQIVMSHRFRAVKLWVVLKRYGTVNMRAYIRRHVSMAEQFERMVVADEQFEAVVPRKFSLVCFRLKPRFEGDDALETNQKLLAAINASGRAFMTHFVVDGKFMRRFVVGAALTEMRHVNDAWNLIQEKAKDFLHR